MYNTKIIEFLKMLTADQMDDLKLFIDSEFHNRGPMRTSTLNLFRILKNNYPDFDHPSLDRTSVYHEIFPEKGITKGKLEKTISELHQLTKEFLLIQNYQKSGDDFQKSMDWAGILKTMKGDNAFEQYVEKIEKEFFQNKNVSPSYYFRKFRFEYEKLSWMNLNNKAKEDINLPNTFISLFSFFEIYRLELANYLLLQQKLTHVDVPEQITKSFDWDFAFIEAQSHIIYEISHRIFQLLRSETPEVSQFNELMELLLSYETQIDSDTLRDYYGYLRSICTILVNTGREEMNSVLHQIHKDNIQRGYLYINEKIHSTTLININRTAIRAGNIHWALEFVESHRDRIMDNIDTHDYYLVNKALGLFAAGQYDEVLDTLPQHSPNIVYHLIARRTEIMCYYELKSELLTYKIEAFKIYIWRASSKFLSVSVQEANKAFVNLLTQLISTTPGDKNRLSILKKRLNSKEEVAELTWLRSKISAME